MDNTTNNATTQPTIVINAVLRAFLAIEFSGTLRFKPL
jgi:hypothetical protein